MRQGAWLKRKRCGSIRRGRLWGLIFRWRWRGLPVILEIFLYFFWYMSQAGLVQVLTIVIIRPDIQVIAPLVTISVNNVIPRDFRPSLILNFLTAALVPSETELVFGSAYLIPWGNFNAVNRLPGYILKQLVWGLKSHRSEVLAVIINNLIFE